MNRRIGAVVAAAVIIVFVAFIIYDISGDRLFSDKPVTTVVSTEEAPAP